MTTHQVPQHAARIPSLDGVRGLAILLVVLGHVSGHGSVLRGYGPIGVTLFFVLSGYLISGLLLGELQRSGRIDLWRFLCRRSVRLLPALLAFLLALPILMWMLADPSLGRYPKEAVAAATYTANLVHPVEGEASVLLHTWSLSMEEQFYLIWPALLWLLIRAPRPRSLLGAVTGLAAVLFFWRITANLILDYERVYFGPDTNAFALLFGCAFAVYERERGLPSFHKLAPRFLIGILMAMVLVTQTLPPERSDLWLAPAAGLASVLLVAAARTAVDSVLAARPLTWLGTVSYSWYLWHFALMEIWIAGHRPELAQRLLCAPLALVIAWLSLEYVERPAIRWYRTRELARLSRPLASGRRSLLARRPSRTGGSG